MSLSQRRVRCDQQKPVCGGCAKFRYECAYPQTIAKTAITLLDKHELRSLSFYREQTANDLCGYFDGDFWTRDILRLSYGNKTLQKFVLALSSLDEAYRLRTQPENTELAVSRYAFSLRQYQEAIQGLTKDITKEDQLVTILTAVIVCICIELWHGDNLMARRHAIAGVQIAQTFHSPKAPARDESESDVLISRQLLPALWRHCAQMGVKMHKQGRPFLQTDRLEYGASALTTKSATFDDARIQFSRLIDLVVSEMEGPPTDQDDECRVQSLLKQFDAWYDDIERLSKTKTTRSISIAREECLLGILYYQATAQLAAIVTNNADCYNDQASAFCNIVTLCKQVLECDSTLKSRNGTRRAFDGVTNSALLLVVWKCSHPQIRRAALRLLYRSRRLEGLWSSNMIGVMAEGIMMIEEARERKAIFSGHGPPTQRIVVTGFHYNPGALERTQQNLTSCEDEPPWVSINYIDPSDTPAVIYHRIQIKLKPYPSAAGFGMKSVFWWPEDDAFAIMNEEIPEETKCLDGAHLGFVPFSGITNTDAQNLLCMRWFTLEFGKA